MLASHLLQANGPAICQMWQDTIHHVPKFSSFELRVATLGSVVLIFLLPLPLGSRDSHVGLP